MPEINYQGTGIDSALFPLTRGLSTREEVVQSIRHSGDITRDLCSANTGTAKKKCDDFGFVRRCPTGYKRSGTCRGRSAVDLAGGTPTGEGSALTPVFSMFISPDSSGSWSTIGSSPPYARHIPRKGVGTIHVGGNQSLIEDSDRWKPRSKAQSRCVIPIHRIKPYEGAVCWPVDCPNSSGGSHRGW